MNLEWFDQQEEWIHGDLNAIRNDSNDQHMEKKMNNFKRDSILEFLYFTFVTELIGVGKWNIEFTVHPVNAAAWCKICERKKNATFP